MANVITGARIVCSGFLLLCPLYSLAFYLLYIAAGLTDVFDGVCARKTGAVSEFGAKFDTAADLVLVAVCLLRLLPEARLPTWLLIWVGAIALIKVINVVSGLVMRKKLVLPHTKANKIAGIVLFLLPLTMAFIDIRYTAPFACAVATFAAVQEGHLIRTGGAGT
ncbi:MAG: CDP-alcohol phosphatidyltransferase family protein [Oscillospiraceae bacterium]|nr:CDP-alcohol phosphatidyltransferase family protein [Oscillospiraceae bacterium]